MKKLLIILFSLPQLLLAQDLNSYESDRTYFDTITFEKIEYNIHIDTSSQNIWQIATPQKNFFDSSYSPAKAILTDSIYDYPINVNSYFDLYISPQIYDRFYGDAFYISFKHKMDTDTLKDGGFITVSRDCGQSWLNIIDDNYNEVNPKDMNINLYDETSILEDSIKGFSGHYDWVKTEFTWHHIPAKGLGFCDTTTLRFNFISDSVDTNKEGWMIDDILIYTVNLKGSISDNSIDMPFQVFPNPSKNYFSILFNEKQSKTKVKIMNQWGQLMYEEMITNSSKRDIQFDITPGIYSLLVESEDQAYSKTIIFK